jgi:cobalt-zinc-cadmium efflux system protein
MPHEHPSYDHDHHHHHAPKSINRAFIIGIILNLGFVFLEALAGFWQHSLALITDAGHNFSDVIGLLFVLMAHRLAKMKPTEKFTYGYSKSTVLVALTNAILLLVAVGALALEAVRRFSDPHLLEGTTISIVAFVGIIINAATALLFFKDKEKDINIKGAYLHMATDALVSLGVVIAGITMIYTHWYWLDSVISLFIIVVIVTSTWGLLRDSLRLTLDGVPSGINVQKIRDYFSHLKEVKTYHDLHIWAMSTTEAAMTVHLVVPEGDTDGFLSKVKHDLLHNFNIIHTTIQIERSGDDSNCVQKC